ncbi:arginase family protein [Streptomyces sp. NPDC047081]|uniref:arginase family protein n=1 Tax=Streptomyces sp. NPDC047081 TaxID=3154706 RepID=UPI0033DBB309
MAGRNAERAAAYRLRPAAAPLLGADELRDLDDLRAAFAVIGVPYGSPYRMENVHSGAADAPRVFRERANARFGSHGDRWDFDLGGTLFGETGLGMVDVGDVVGDPRDLPGTAAAATEAMRVIVDRGAAPVVLGGDDSVPILCARAFAADRPVINVLQIDAHIDFRDEVDGIRDGYSSPVRRMSEMPWVGQIVQVGARGTGSARPEDLAAALEAGNVVVPAEQVHSQGVDAVTAAMRDDLPWFVTLDVDGLDPTIAPGTSCPLPGGLDFRQAGALFAAVGRDFDFAGIDIVEHFPGLDVGTTTSVTLSRLLSVLIGHAARRRAAAHACEPAYLTA